MLLKIFTVTVCIVALVGARSRDFEDCMSCHNTYKSLGTENCEALRPNVRSHSWYQAGAMLKVDDGIFTVKFTSNNSALSSLNAEGKGVVRLKRGFANITSLEWFSLEDNFIEIIESHVFEGLPELTYLSLARNRISSIEENGFQGLHKLKVLNLNHNALAKTIDFSISDATLPALTQLYLQHNQLEHLSTHHQKLHLCNSNLEQLYLSNNSLRWFHVGTDDDLHNSCLKRLAYLFLEDNDLEQFDSGALQLEALSLDGNNIREIPKIFKRLEFLSLARNRIEFMPNFKNAKNIVRLILSHNLINDRWVSGSFQNLPSLEYLALDNNLLQSVPTGFFSNLISLQTLYLSHNGIKDISPKAFVRLPALQELYFDHNDLKNFPGEGSFGENNLSFIDLSHNKQFMSISIKSDDFPELRVVNIIGTSFEYIPLIPRQVTVMSSDCENLYEDNECIFTAG